MIDCINCIWSDIVTDETLDVVLLASHCIFILHFPGRGRNYVPDGLFLDRNSVLRSDGKKKKYEIAR